jgi:histidyl-tRNA synthetase
MSLADRLGATFVVILGDQELAEGKAALRRMATGGQDVLPLTELVPALKARLGHKEGN